MKYLSIHINSVENALPYQKEQLNGVVDMLEAIVNSNVFKKRFMKLKLNNTMGLSNAEVLEVIFDGAELANPEVDNDIDLNIDFYTSDSNVMGLANEDINRIRLNTKYYDHSHISIVTQTVMHEWLHNIGFDHNSFVEHSSVPYVTGFLVRDLVSEYADRIYEMGIPEGKKRLKIYRPCYFLWLVERLKWQ